MGIEDVLRVGSAALELGLISSETLGRKAAALVRGELEADPVAALADVLDPPTLAALIEGSSRLPQRPQPERGQPPPTGTVPATKRGKRLPHEGETPGPPGPLRSGLGVLPGGSARDPTEVELPTADSSSLEAITRDGSVRRRVRPATLAWTDDADRYRGEALLGRGALGRVELARDLLLGRSVALKTPIADGHDEHARLMQEARLAAQLEHPNVVPVYDAGRLPDGRPFYTMRVVRGRSLAEILGGLRRSEGADDWTLPRLIGALRQVCLALDYAHARGVVHCDLKPGNLMLGSYGEVQVVDWGLARVYKLVGEEPILLDPDSKTSGGTPAYMAPEQAVGDAKLTPAVDVYALGVILFELLTLRRPFEGDDAHALLDAHLSRPPPEPAAVAVGGREVPPPLGELALRALAKHPSGRPASARRLADELGDWLEGRKDRERREAEARRGLADARHVLDELATLEADADATRALLAEVRRRIAPHDPVDVKRRAWSLEDRVRETERGIDERVGRAIVLLDRSVALSGAVTEAADLRARLYAEQLVRSEAIGDARGSAYYGALAREYATPSVARLLDPRGGLDVTSSPTGALVRVFRYVERDRRLVPELHASPGTTPLATLTLMAGSYLVQVEREGSCGLRVPVVVPRGGRAAVHVHLHDQRICRDGFVQIAASEFTLGGDALAPEGLPAEDVQLGDFFVARYPVTEHDYAEWLDALGPPGSPERRLRTPYEREADVVAARHGATRREGAPREGSAASTRMAVQGVSWFDAIRYVQWRSQRDGVAYRLVTDAEWEKAARGADGRLYPWGNTFDATFCKMRDSRAGAPRPEPIGTFPSDESPYGVRDLAGGTREWVADVHAGAAQPRLELENDADVTTLMAVIRGGAWDKPAVSCRLAARLVTPAINRFALAGLRLAFDPPRR